MGILKGDQSEQAWAPSCLTPADNPTPTGSKAQPQVGTLVRASKMKIRAPSGNTNVR